MAGIRGRVLEINPPGNDAAVIAYLYNFRVDKAFLRKEHKLWLQRNLILPILQQSGIPIKKTFSLDIDNNGMPVVYPGIVPPYKPPPPNNTPVVMKGDTMIVTTEAGSMDTDRLLFPDRWTIWLHGTTSRPASRGYNLSLSQRRAEAVAVYIRQNLGEGPPYYHIDPFWYGEFFAEMAGKSEHRENPLDRAVLVAFRPVYPDVGLMLGPPAPVNRPCCQLPCQAVKDQIDYLEAVQAGWAVTGTPGAGGTIDDTGDNPDSASGPFARPDMAFTTAKLRAKGFSANRAMDLYNSGDRFMSVQLVNNSGPGGFDVNNVQDRIIKAIADARKDLAHCTKGDPYNIYSKDFTYRKSD
jgi:hypothetical protein